ncbi:MAG: hypothetical protein HY565_02845 [Candidatus Kerfeldbacteria bacterium]|nr:hypothetical protein [Candidatus Kerfeldbacteria bacterium]
MKTDWLDVRGFRVGNNWFEIHTITEIEPLNLTIPREFCDVRDKAYRNWSSGCMGCIPTQDDEEIVNFAKAIPLVLCDYLQEMIVLGSSSTHDLRLTYNRKKDKWEVSETRWYPDNPAPIICPQKK